MRRQAGDEASWASQLMKRKAQTTREMTEVVIRYPTTPLSIQSEGLLMFLCNLILQIVKGGVVKGPWQKHEDEIILRCLEEGITKWSDIADRVTGRIGKQCRERFFNHLDREYHCRSPCRVHIPHPAACASLNLRPFELGSSCNQQGAMV